jgi:hypothetical protein
LRLITSGVLAAIAGAAMTVAVSSSPSFAFTLSSPSVTDKVTKADVQQIYYYRRYYYHPYYHHYYHPYYHPYYYITTITLTTITIITIIPTTTTAITIDHIIRPYYQQPPGGISASGRFVAFASCLGMASPCAFERLSDVSNRRRAGIADRGDGGRRWGKAVVRPIAVYGPGRDPRSIFLVHKEWLATASRSALRRRVRRQPLQPILHALVFADGNVEPHPR